MKIFIFIIAILTLPIFICASAKNNNSSTIYKQHVEKNIDLVQPEPISDFTFDELVKLSQTPEPKADLKAKLNNHLSMVYAASNNNSYKLDKPYLRIAHWNIKRGYNVSEIKEILLDKNAYEKKYITNIRPRNQKHFKEELNTFATTDILCLNEVDIGMPRTKYKNILLELSDSLKWNYAYVSEFIEVGPLFQKQKVDQTLYKGLHGNAIISKFPHPGHHAVSEILY